MCFSATASFSAAAIIGVVGFIALKNSKTKSERFFAGIPALFAVQQLIEGSIWIVTENSGNTKAAIIFSYAYLLFAWVLWPLYIPLSMYFLETVENRKKIFQILIGSGSFVSLVLSISLFIVPIEVSACCGHITYIAKLGVETPVFITILYLLVSTISLFISSVKYMWILGITVSVGYLFTQFLFQGYEISVWCFFAAIASIEIVFILQKNKTL